MTSLTEIVFELSSFIIATDIQADIAIDNFARKLVDNADIKSYDAEEVLKASLRNCQPEIIKMLEVKYLALPNHENFMYKLSLDFVRPAKNKRIYAVGIDSIQNENEDERKRRVKKALKSMYAAVKNAIVQNVAEWMSVQSTHIYEHLITVLKERTTTEELFQVECDDYMPWLAKVFREHIQLKKDYFKKTCKRASEKIISTLFPRANPELFPDTKDASSSLISTTELESSDCLSPSAISSTTVQPTENIFVLKDIIAEKDEIIAEKDKIILQLKEALYAYDNRRVPQKKVTRLV